MSTPELIGGGGISAINEAVSTPETMRGWQGDGMVVSVINELASTPELMRGCQGEGVGLRAINEFASSL